MGFTVLVLSMLSFCFAIGSRCHEDWIDCGNGKCVAYLWKCDGDNDCGNLRDEMNCDEIPRKGCLDDQFQCVASRHCIPQKWHCDGEHDCQDNSDEVNCDEIPPKACLDNQFKCVADGHCIPKTCQCDGKHDCEDNSDEVNCVQMPEASALLDQNEDLATQVKDLQRNVTELWTYIHTLRNAVTKHLNHLRQHQVELESTCHRLEHAQGGTHASHTDDHHSGEHHSHSGEHHSHSGEHHSHSGEHQSHGDDHQHSHSGEHHSHSGSGDHSHDSHSGGEDHSHDSHSGGGDHSHDSHSGAGGDHSHDSHSHTSEDSHSSHGEGGHWNARESQDLQQSQQPTIEPLVLPSVQQSHSHGSHSHGSHSHGSHSHGSHSHGSHSHGSHHHNPQPLTTSNLTRTVIPKYSEYGLYDFAVCNVQPNRAIPEEQQQNVMGQVTLFQKKLGGPLNLHVRLQGFNMGGHHGAHQALQTAQVQQLQDPMVEEENEAPPAGHRHGFHIHTSGDLSNGCQSTGPHYNPKGVNHGGPNALVRHVGDLGNIECDDHGIANLLFNDPVASLRGQYSIIGKSLVIHSGQDDYGLGGDEESLRTGNAGTRIACCVIQKVDKIPVRQYKAMKTAIQYQN